MSHSLSGFCIFHNQLYSYPVNWDWYCAILKPDWYTWIQWMGLAVSHENHQRFSETYPSSITAASVLFFVNSRQFMTYDNITKSRLPSPKNTWSPVLSRPYYTDLGQGTSATGQACNASWFSTAPDMLQWLVLRRYTSHAHRIYMYLFGSLVTQAFMPNSAKNSQIESKRLV